MLLRRETAVKRLMKGLAVTAGAAALAAGTGGAASAAVQVSQSGWQWGNPTPQGNTIRAMDFTAGRGYAIGDDGTALRTDDGGTTWTGLSTGTSQDLTRVQAVTPDVVVVLGGGGCVVRRSDDGGRTFRKVYVLAETDCPDKVSAVTFVTPQVGYLFQRNGDVLRTSDGGQTFSRVTAVPGTASSAGGGAAVPGDAVFATPDAGLVFLNGTNVAYRTTDGGASWQPAAIGVPGTVERVRAITPTTYYAFGPDTLLQSVDGGATWARRGAGNGNHITGINCATAELCLMSTAAGDKLLRSENGGGTADVITASTQALFAAGFASPTRAVAAGAGGATVVSDDSGRNYVGIGGDIAGSFPFGLRPGPGPDIALALGARGQIARTVDGGITWRAINVATSADMQDTSFATRDAGYALDVRGGLFRTSNGGLSWQPIDPGTTSAPRAVITSGDAVLLAGPRGVRRARDGGAFDLVASRAARRADVNRFDRAGSTVFAFGQTTIIRSADRGRTWTSLRGPGRRTGKRKRFSAYRLRDLEMTSASSGYALERSGRVWRTRDGGRSWTMLPGVGTSTGVALAFGSAGSGYLTLGGYPADTGASYVLRTSDGGATWRPQRIATGTFPGTEGVISPSATKAYALTSTPAAGASVFRSLFATSTGGDAGTPSKLTVASDRRTVTRKQLKRADGRLSVTGALAGAQGGEPIVVSSRPAGGERWSEQVVTAGANGGRYTATFRVTGTTEVVARWAGDSGRQGAGSSVLTIRVKK
jgi:photosystem II stability/assembly factor-like uncharacterized protein